MHLIVKINNFVGKFQIEIATFSVSCLVKGRDLIS